MRAYDGWWTRPPRRAARLPTHGTGRAHFSAGTLWLIDGLGRYLGETVIANAPRTRWAAGHARAKGYMFQNQPVVHGLADEESPLHTTAIVVARALRADPVRGATSLREVYDTW